MSKLMEKLRKEAKKQKKKREERSSSSGVDWFSPEKGDNIIRILPHWKDKDEVFFKHVFLHYGIPFKKDDGEVITISGRCLREFEEDCPICDVYEKVVKKNKEKAKDFKVTERYLYNVIDYKAKQLKVYNAPISVHGEVMMWVEEFDSDISDPNTGRDFKIKKLVDPKKQPRFGTSYKIIPGLKETAVPTKLKSLLKELTNLDEVYNENHRESMEAVVESLGITPASKTKGKSKKKKEEEELDFEEDDKKEEETAFADDSDDTEEEESEDMEVEADDDLDKEIRDLGL